MSSGTSVILDSLRNIGKHSIANPADPESIIVGMNRLNSMVDAWKDEDIEMRLKPLKDPADPLDEPRAVRNAIVDNLSLEMAPLYDNGNKSRVSRDLKRNAALGMQKIKGIYQVLVIPKKVVSSTLPVGEGNSQGVNRRVFFGKDNIVAN